MSVFRALAALKRLRGTPLDIFGRTAERRRERQLISDYEATVRAVMAELRPENHELAVAIANVPETIRGYGHVKRASIERAKAREAELIAAYRRPSIMAAAE
jgi:indolepyruvate ferredoxin oxidoreductase